ncbi:hypothetical protein V2J09_007909 [Rumex salicifolius]
MGSCISDLKGGQEAIGGNKGPTGSSSGAGGGGLNDAVDFFYRARGLEPLYTQLELSLSAKDLLDMDIMSKSDPMVVVYQKKRNGNLDEIGRTEVILNNLSPEWIKKVQISYQFETVQTLEFHVYDVDTKFHKLPVKALNLREQDFLGAANCVLSEIVTKRDSSLTMKLQSKNDHGRQRNLGTLTVHAEEAVSQRSAVELVFNCKNLDDKDLFSKSDPFLRISRIVEGGQAVPICKTEVIMNNLNPTWKRVTLSVQQYGSKDNPLIIECFDFDTSGNHKLIGKIQKSVQDFENMHREKTGANFVKLHRGHEKISKGQIFVESFVEKQLYSFLDYISSGFELNFMVAVDFTGSNGDPRSSTSLHYIDPLGRLNAYQQAIMDVAEVIQFYDSDRRFPAWGFGGKVNGSISHCFNLNGNPYADEVAGIEGIMTSYSSAIHTVALAGPTLFGRVIDKAARIASQSHDSSKYYVLLILTDGVLTDLQETINSLVKASDLPLSILIVGVGDADFTQMEILDADNGPKLQSSTCQVATRDMVQFIPINKVQRDEISVVQSLLEELPGQFLTYMRSRDIKPRTFNPSAPHL